MNYRDNLKTEGKIVAQEQWKMQSYLNITISIFRYIIENIVSKKTRTDCYVKEATTQEITFEDEKCCYSLT